jgi:hypothetical protein
MIFWLQVVLKVDQIYAFEWHFHQFICIEYEKIAMFMICLHLPFRIEKKRQNIVFEFFFGIHVRNEISQQQFWSFYEILTHHTWKCKVNCSKFDEVFFSINSEWDMCDWKFHFRFFFQSTQNTHSLSWEIREKRFFIKWKEF